jgi:hypothetical protein
MPERGDRNNACDGIPNNWKQAPQSSVKQKRLIVVNEKLIEREAPRGHLDGRADAVDPIGYLLDIRA